MNVKELLNRLNELVSDNPHALNWNVSIQIDAESIRTVDIDNINVECGNVTLEGEW